MNLHLDFETRSRADLKKVGAWAYAMDPSTEILCMGVGRRGSEPTVYTGKWHSWRWDLKDDAVVSAHNAQFEYAIYHFILHKRYGWPARTDPKLWSCTLARAAMVGLPLDLDGLGRVLKIKTPKDLEGRRVMLQLCKPRADGSWDETPEKLQRLYQYNATDVRAEMEVDALLPELPPHERAIWEQDLLINRRGVAVDLDFARKASVLAERLTTELNGQLRVMTRGAVDSATRVASMKKYLAANGVAVPVKKTEEGEKETLDKVAVTNLLASDAVPAHVKKVLEIRRQVGKSSTAKFLKTLECACADGRVRGALQYHAAHTGRWGGRMIQPQNYPKGFDEAAQAQAISLVDDPSLFAAVYGERAMDALSDSLRGTIIAPAEKLLVSADFNAIEARVNFWLAGDQSALATYRAGGSPYLDMGAYIFKRPITKKDAHEYAVAKMTILGAGFGMGPVRFFEQCASVGVTISEELAKTAIYAFREKYAAVKNLWFDVEKAAINAVRSPGETFPSCHGKVLWRMSSDGRFLCAKLPSGRYLWYWKPSVRLSKTKWGEEKMTLFYWGPHPKTNEWVELHTYGGALTENVTQAVARDLMANGMAKVEAGGFPVVLTVHDELLSEVAAADANLDKFMKLMCDTPVWAAGLPVVAEGWTARRYKK